MESLWPCWISKCSLTLRSSTRPAAVVSRCLATLRPRASTLGGFFSFKREVKYMQISFSNLTPHASLYALRHLNLQPFFHGCASATERLTQQKKNNNNNIQLLSAGFDYVSNKQNISYYGGGGGPPASKI